MVKQLFSRENITFLLAVIGSLLSIYNFTISSIEKRRKLSVDIDCALTDTGYLLMSVSIVNKSRLPIVISNGSLMVGCTAYHFGERSIAWYTYKEPSKMGKAVERTVRFPLSIAGLDYYTGIFAITEWKETKCNDCTIKLRTNRGIVVAQTHMPAVTDSYIELLQHLK